MNVWLTAALWMALALAASIVSVRLAISVALTEILFGILGGNALHLQVTEWVNFLAGFGSVMLTFLAGAELEPEVLKRHWKESIAIGLVGFFAPFLGAWAYALYIAHWNPNAAQICGIALSTTSVAVVYAVMIETGFNRTEIGKVILAACFVNDLGTVLALGIAFANYNVWLLLFVIVTTGVLMVTPKATRWFFGSFQRHVSEPEIKFLFLLLFFLGGLAAEVNSEAVLTAYLLGLVVASVLQSNKRVVEHMRSTVFTMLTPFYFLKAGSYVLLGALWTSIGLTVLLFLVKMIAKVIGVYPTCLAFGLRGRVASYTTGMMSTGLTFGTISALFGLTHHYINQVQYTVLVTVVIGSALVPTMIAQTFFRPQVEIPPEAEVVEKKTLVTQPSSGN
ncbi:MAG TPA: cation:proton antiporter [Chthonomonas sp.]|jgi:Kef-type K+ transport system membrane component KefB|uniref:cation:proton antiporter n=1 Tax=Chthonomonas sp. TaxID=2282153 RepID=UPI002B4AD3D3|nr:cation:proton antiporter [Chthonomonas sp.]HLH79131.1 cation:proton antiporter [Chthonomonas sp.]